MNAKFQSITEEIVQKIISEYNLDMAFRVTFTVYIVSEYIP